MQNDRLLTTEELLNQYAPLVRKAVRENANGWFAYEELWQEGCCLLLEGYRDYRPETGVPLPGFLKAKVRFGLQNFVRRRQKEAKRFPFSLDKPGEEGEPFLHRILGGEDPAQVFLRREEEEIIRQVLLALPEKQRKVLVLLYWQGLSVKQIANLANVSHQAVAKLKAKGLREAARRLGM